MKNLLISIGLGLAILASGFSVYQVEQAQPVVQQQALGAFNPTGGGTYYLQASINSTQTTMTLTSFTEPSSNIPYTMSYLNSSIEYGTINPNSPTSEFISFTGITQNANGTALLTGVTRGLGRSYPYTASTTLAHSVPGQTQFILSSPPQFFNQYYALANISTSTNYLIFASTTPPHYDFNPPFSSFPTTTLASVGYVNDVALSGAPNASETVKGIAELSTTVEAAAGTSLGGTGARLVLPGSMANATPSANVLVPITSAAGKLAQGFLDLTQTFVWSALHTFNAGFISTASSTFSATTTIAASNVLNKAVIFNGVPYAFPSSQGTRGSVLANDGSGNLTWGFAPKYTVSMQNITVTNGYATSSAINVPAGVLNASSTIQVTGNAVCATGVACVYYLRTSTGITIDSCSPPIAAANTYNQTISFSLVNVNAVNSQFSVHNCLSFNQTPGNANSEINSTVSAIDLSQATGFVMVIQNPSGTVQAARMVMVITP